ncbi:MAG TPA: hypothetical protein VF593_07180 [Chthoniobacteraceae bacterium]|jgi:hypothetical protein
MFPAIEPLEPRIAPASALAFYTDQDGDDVTIKITTSGGSSAALAAALENAQELSATGVGLQLRALHLSDAVFAGANVSITATRSAQFGGDGLVAVGELDSSGSLGTVVVEGDLGRIAAGAGAGTLAVKSLTVQSLGRYGMATGDSTFSSLEGSVGKISVKEDVVGATLNINGTTGVLSIAGNLEGGNSANSITITGDAGIISIGGHLISGTGSGSGKLRVLGDVTSLTVGGSLVGPSDGGNDPVGQIDIAGNAGKVLIKGDVIGGTDAYGVDRSQLTIAGTLASLQVNGSLLGSADGLFGGAGAGEVRVVGAAGSVKVLGDIVGSGSAGSGALTLLTAKTIFVGGDLIAGIGTSTGMIDLGAGTVQSLTVKGNIIGGTGSLSAGGIDGTLETILQKVVIGGNLESRGDLSNQGFIAAGFINNLLIKGDVIASGEDGSTTEQIQGLLGLGKVVIGGAIRGNELNTVKIFADELQSLLVTRNAEWAEIAITEADAQVKSLTVNGAWIASRFTFATDNGADDIFGTNDDPAVGVNATGSIAKIVIAGQVSGTVGAGDSFVIRAPKIGSLTVAKQKYPFTTGPQVFSLSITADVAARDTL